ncbi:esterase/lipase [Deinococcus sp. HSC-46F16]|uniref:alpha/beta hydrolase n=1 Tax=Deinococcus sp. HSC-46F16 TaxID=2910968 RepID=UPI0020A0C8F3|nr:esterase/lipase [Deinococcus sp. HSC-46F16]
MTAATPVPEGTRTRLTFPAGGEAVPAVWLRPEVPAPGQPAALLLHGFSSRGDVMADTVGRALLRRGVASLSPDLPLHGTRGDPLELQALRNPLELARLWRLALREAGAGVEFLQGEAGQVGVVGYSLGSFLSVVLASQRREVGAVVLAAGGDLPGGTPLTAVARTVADPLRAAHKLGGRPLLMLNGRHDPVIRPEQAERLYAAASGPKELRWWEGGHAVPSGAVDEGAEWLAGQLGVGK